MDLISSKTMTHGELFAGISGFGLGFARAGIKTIWHVEIDVHCQKVLRRHYPGALLLSDIKDCGIHNLPPVDIISFGSPCQDLSVAGKRVGLINGKKSNLFFEAIRIVDELKPTFAVWENVPGAFSSNSGRDFATVLSAFQNIGACDIAWTCLDAQYFGVAQRRRRVFLVSDFRGNRAAKILFESESSAWNSAPSREKGEKPAFALAASIRKTGDGHGQGWYSNYVISRPLVHSRTIDHYDESQQTYVLAQNGSDVRVDDLPGALMAGMARQTSEDLIAFQSKASAQNSMNPGKVVPALSVGKAGGACVAYGVSENQRAELRLTPYSRQLTSGGGKPGQGYPAALTRYGVRRLTPTECELLQGFEPGWTAGQSDSARYRQLGNAVCVPVAEWIGKRIMETENGHLPNSP
jgi:DNA (cytosine-5)-methyltransferase 1